MTTILSLQEHEALSRVLECIEQLPAGRRVAVLDAALARVDVGSSFARGIAGPLGKLDCLVKTHIDEITNEGLLRKCNAFGTDRSSLMRNCVYTLVHDKSYDEMVIERLSHNVQRTNALSKLLGQFQAPELGGGQHD